MEAIQSKTKEYKFESEKCKLKIQLSIKDINNIHFIAINTENEYEIYELNTSLSELIKTSDYFQLCKTPEDFINYLRIKILLLKKIIYQKH